MKVRKTVHLPKKVIKALAQMCDKMGFVSLSRCAESAIKAFVESGAFEQSEKKLDAKVRLKFDYRELERFEKECKKMGYSNIDLCFATALEHWLEQFR